MPDMKTNVIIIISLNKEHILSTPLNEITNVFKTKTHIK